LKAIGRVREAKASILKQNNAFESLLAIASLFCSYLNFFIYARRFWCGAQIRRSQCASHNEKNGNEQID